MKSTMKAFAAGVVQDAADIKSAWNGIYDGFAEKSQVANEKAKSYNKKTIDELLQNYPKVEVAVKKTAETAKAAFTDAADALKQINAAETTTELAELGVALALAFNDGILTQEQYTEALETSKQKLAELKAEAENAATSAGERDSEKSGKQQVAAAKAGQYDCRGNGSPLQLYQY